VRYLPVDLLDAQDCRAQLAGRAEVTHVFYTARAAHGEGGHESVEDNLAMLANVMDAIEPVAAELRHVHLVEGGKWYGLHLGPYKTPAREDDPRHLPPNFYYDQQDFLAARQQGKSWTWSASRPNVIVDFAPGRARNLVSVLGAYAAICRELDVPLDFPGPPGAFTSLTEVTDGTQLARAMLWMATEERCANQAFNITNGDLFRWQDVWPKLAEHFAMPAGRVRQIRLAEWMADKAPVWQRVVARNGLEPTPFEDVALWAFGDFALGQTFDLISDMTTARRFGFHEVVDSEAMLFRMLEQYRAARLLP
jgi:nucleoside-diphosphate-sugar epimerase